MQPPLTPQRGRIESNPREYTHMGPSTNLPDERGFSDEIGRQKLKNRPMIHARASTTYLSPHIHLYDEG